MNVQIESLNIKLLMLLLLFILDRYTLLQCNKFIRALLEESSYILAIAVTT